MFALLELTVCDGRDDAGLSYNNRAPFEHRSQRTHADFGSKAPPRSLILRGILGRCFFTRCLVFLGFPVLSSLTSSIVFW